MATYYRIEMKATGPAITCLHCGMTSYNPKDVEEKFCGHCNVFLEDESHCDFCLAAAPLPATYYAKTAITGDLPSGKRFVDSGEWGACENCQALIQAKKWDDLAEIAVNCLIVHNPTMDYPNRRERLKHRMLLMLAAIFEGEVGCKKCHGPHPTAMCQEL